MSSPLSTPQPSPAPTLTSSSSSLPLAGVRVFLHVRHAPADTRHGAKRPPSARAVLKSLRAQVQQLGATLALSDAAADLIVVYHGSDAFVAAAQERQKTVVGPDYLSACSASHQRVSPTSFLLPPAALVEGGAAALRSPEGKQKSASRASGGSTPCRTASTTAAAAAAAAHVSGPSPRSSAASPVMLHRPILLDDEDGNGVVAEQRAASHLANSNEKPSAARRTLDSPDASTPRLTPTGTKDALSPLSSLATTQELVVVTAACGATPTSAAPKACETAAGAEEGEREEEERIRHAVLCCTAAEGTTRRRARQRRASVAASTPIAAAASATTVAPPSATSTSSFVEMSDECLMDSIVRPRRRQHAKTAPSRLVDPFLSSDSLTSAPPLIATQQQQQQQQQRSAPSLTVSYSDLGSASITQPLDTPDAPPPSAAPFSSLLVAPPLISPPQKRTRSRGTRVRRAPVDGQPKAPAKRLKAERVVAENGLRSRRAARSKAPFLQEMNDILEVPLSTRFSDTSLLHRLPDKDAAHLRVRIFTDDAGGVAALLRDVVVQLGASPVDDDAIHRSGWAGQGKKPTHLVASPAALLTPELLFHKARGVPIVTPQWVYDAIAMGGFPVVVPRLHAHPIFGDRETPAAAVNGGAAVVVTVVDNNTTRELVLGEENEEETRRAALSPLQPLLQPLPQQQQPMSAQLRQLHKEVAEEYVPAGEQAYRPYYRPIFRDCMVYLYVPPVDLAAAHTSATRRTPKTKGTMRNDAQTHNYFGDVVAALEQATQLVRLLGGTVTRNLGSTYLDLVLDLTGFYEQTIEAGQQQQQQQQLRQQRALGESLSYAYHDALQRLSCCQLPPANDHADASMASAAEHVSRPSGPPPIVGIAWLVYSILQRQKADVTPFLLAPHPLAASLAALHVKQAAVTTRCGSSGSESLAAPVAPVKVPTPTFTDSSSSLSSCTPRSAPALSPEWTPSSPAPWPSMSLAAQQRKCARGPHAAQKDSVHQLDTQEVAAMLHAAQPSSSSFPHSFSKRGTSSSTSRDGKENGVETYHHHVAASCGEASDVIGL